MADFYGTAAGYKAYVLAHYGVTVTEEDAVIVQWLLRGSAYIDGRYRKQWPSGRWQSLFPGVKTGGRAQLREWGRTGASDYEGNPIGPNEIPIELEYATYEAAKREGEAPGSLSPDYIAAELVTKEKVGPLEVSYAESVEGSIPTRPVITLIDELIAPLLVSRFCGIGVAVV